MSREKGGFCGTSDENNSEFMWIFKFFTLHLINAVV